MTDTPKICPTCGGTGDLPEAIQAWDIPGAPVPECPTCVGKETVKE